MEDKTITEIYRDDLRDLHFIKISTNAKNLPEVLHNIIKKYKEEK